MPLPDSGERKKKRKNKKGKTETKENTKQPENSDAPKLHPRVQEANKLREQFSAVEVRGRGSA